MKKIKAFIHPYVFSNTIPLKAKLLNITYLCGIVLASVAVVTRILMGAGIYLLLVILAIILSIAALMYICNRFRLYDLCIKITIILVCDILLPAVYFLLGGVAGSSVAYFILSVVIIFLLSHGKSCIIFLTTHIVLVVVCYYLSYRYPNLVISQGGITRNFRIYLDHIQSFLIVGICIGLIIKFQNAIYLIEKKKKDSSHRAIIRQDKLRQAVNQAAAVLFASEVDRFNDSMQKAMKIMARVIGVDRMFIWKNQTIEGKSCFMPIFQWVNDPSLQMNEKKEGVSLAAGSASDGEAKFFQGISINGPLCTFDPDLKDRIACYGAVSVLAIPVILDDYFWGFVSFDDCRQKRFFSSSEEGVLRSSAMLLANAVIRNEMTQSLIQAKEDALAGTKAKSEFLARMSHEIRTPLNAILGFSEAELRNSLSDETRINLEKIYGSGFHLLEIINEILDISKIESGNFNIIPAEYDFPSMVNDVVQLNIVRIGSKPIKFSLIMDETIPARLFGDEVRIKQILNNLLSNSFKYTEKGAVHLAINWEQRNDKAWLNFVVEDTGRGIRKENLEKLFSEYAQFDTAANHRIEGTGLGLSITQRLVQMMEGTITVESEYGKGSIFRVNVPQGIADEKPIGKELADRLMVFDFIKDRSRSPENSFIRSYMPYGKVLVVDDLQINLDVMKELLMSYGIKVDTVLSGQEAVERIRAAEVRYDLVFMDHMMPEMDGLEAVRIIRNEIGSPYAQQIAIIALTANAVTGNKEIFLNNGFDDFISKPIDIKQLDMVLNQWIRDKQNDAVLKGAENQSPGGQETRGRSGEKQIDLDGEWLLDHPVDGLDFAAALVLYGNSGATYISMLKSFIVHVPLLLEKMNLHLESSLPDYMVAVHGLKGICNTVCAKGTAEFAKELEFASKEGNFDMVRSRHGELGRQVLQLTERLKVLLDKWKRDRPPEEKEKEQRAEPDQELLARLSEAAVECNVTLTEGILEELEQYQYVRETELVEWLRVQAENFDYDAIHKRLDGLPRNS